LDILTIATAQGAPNNDFEWEGKMDRSPRIVYVEWSDPTSIDAWTHRRDIDPKSQTIRSCGLFLKEAEKFLVIALNEDSLEDNFSCIQIIPKILITRRLEIHEALDNA